MKKLSNQKGFTLIELVVVIVILGILAATAAPRFIDLTSDARKSVMEGVQGSINSAVNLAQSKALIEGVENGTIEIGSEFFVLVNGYPAVDDLGDGSGDSAVNAKGISGLVELDSNSEIMFDAANDRFYHDGANDADTDQCAVTYANATDTETRPALSDNLDTTC